MLGTTPWGLIMRHKQQNMAVMLPLVVGCDVLNDLIEISLLFFWFMGRRSKLAALSENSTFVVMLTSAGVVAHRRGDFYGSAARVCDRRVNDFLGREVRHLRMQRPQNISSCLMLSRGSD
ncbi:hypothetical protein M011DRAFT_349715 [Sporormia fimetaria CBS 119925]|uniref:Uncharacterized protein n=1 Tax=Sporormia fimetaria CBS 119925 TaxID=1340428 RepID=A0A6A6VFU3_9PLEO|nr:hypothetical protein M011DRAFT_349715 [Sporormia fimetaria CBS 119925]